MTRPIRMIDLFAGVGGIRMGFENAAKELRKQGHAVEVESVFASEWDKFAKLTYEANHGELPHGDITDEDVQAAIPDFDIMLAGFPCQPFSLAGVSKKNSLGRDHGFKDKTQGTLFHEIVKIVDEHRPAAFFLENVKHLERHDRGKTFEVIAEALDGLGYRWDYGIRNASKLVPQNRERIFIIGYRDDLDVEPLVPEIEQEPVAVRDILHEYADGGKVPTTHWRNAPESLEKYTLSDHLWGYLKDYALKHQKAGNGFGFGLVDNLDGVTRTLSARYHKDGSEILIPVKGAHTGPDGLPTHVRRLTPRECARLQGYPDTFKLVCSDTQCYRQFGNSVAVPVIEHLATTVLTSLATAGRALKVA